MNSLSPEKVLVDLGPQWLEDLVEDSDKREPRDAVRNAVLTGMEVMRERMEEEAVIENTCVCLSRVTSATLRRGYCSTCTRPITIKVGTHGL